MSNKSFSISNNNQKEFSFDNLQKNLLISNVYILDFTKCTVDNYPKDRKDFEKIIDTFKDINIGNLAARDKHKLDNKYEGKNKDKICGLISVYGKVYSLDVYHRNGNKGGIRLLYTEDITNAMKLYILDCFIDDH